jgi:hypothetical protein
MESEESAEKNLEKVKKTDAYFKGKQPKEKGYKVTDSGGLHLFVSPGGGKSWRYKFTFGGKERRIVFGAYPDVSLKRAREMRDDAKRMLRDGRDPSLEAQRAKHTRKVGHENTFEMFARSWHENEKSRWKEVHANDVITSMERDLFPSIGGFPVEEIDEGSCCLRCAMWSAVVQSKLRIGFVSAPNASFDMLRARAQRTPIPQSTSGMRSSPCRRRSATPRLRRSRIFAALSVRSTRRGHRQSRVFARASWLWLRSGRACREARNGWSSRASTGQMPIRTCLVRFGAFQRKS